MSLIQLHIYAFMVALVAFIYSDVLTEPHMIFNKLYNKLELLLPEYLFKPIIGCFRCVSGQMAFWVYVYKYGSNYLENSSIIALSEHIYFVSLAIYLSWIINKVYRKEI